jgi:uncharacterized protein YdhG (YjbR/CyaY superfamily)
VSKPESVEAYLAGLTDDRRARLEDLRRTVKAAAPEAVEVISYNMPAYQLGKRFVLSFSAFKQWDSLFPASDVVLAEIEQARPYVHERSTFRFPVKDPLPLDLIKRIVEVRMDEVAREG